MAERVEPRLVTYICAALCTTRLVAFLVVAGVYLHGLGHPLLWSDEADTGIEARAVLRSGVPSAIDARNVSLFDDGSQLDRSFRSKKLPWIPYYVGAASLAVFGDDTRGLRVAFALIGACALFPIASLLRRRVPLPNAAAALVLLAPQVVLLQRNARYYAVLIALYATLVWVLDSTGLSRRAKTAALSGLFVLLFHTQPVAAACAGGSLIAYGLLWRRGDTLSYCLAVAAGFAAWFAWYASLGPPLASTGTTLEAAAANFSGWIAVTWDGLVATGIDFDAVDCLPLLIGGGLVAAALLLHRGRKAWAAPLFGFVGLNLVVQALATAGLLGYETAHRFAILRYEPHLLVFALVALVAAWGKFRAPPILFISVATLGVATNFGSLSFWVRPWDRRPPWSWAVPVYREIFAPPAEALALAFDRLRTEAPPGADPVLYPSPAWIQDMAIFYLGDRYRITPPFSSASARSLPLVAEALGMETLRRVEGPPDWIVDAGRFFRVPDGYAPAAVFPSARARPDEGARPELTRHTFAGDSPASDVTLYRRTSIQPQ